MITLNEYCKKFKISNKTKIKLIQDYSNLGFIKENDEILVPKHFGKIDLRRKSKSENLGKKLIILLKAINNEYHMSPYLLNVSKKKFEAMIDELLKQRLIINTKEFAKYISENYITTIKFKELKYDLVERIVKAAVQGMTEVIIKKSTTGK